MYCSKCQKEISDSSKFCKYCGNKINEIIDTNIQKQQEKPKTQSKIIIHGYTGAYINIPVKVYEDNKQIGKINKGETFEYEISETKTLTLKCHIRSTEITVMPNKVTEIQLKFNNLGQLIYTYGKMKDRVNSISTTEDNTTIESIEENKGKDTNATTNSIVYVIITILLFAAIATFITIHNTETSTSKETKGKVTLSNYNQISVGMDYNKVIDLLGQYNTKENAVGLVYCFWFQTNEYGNVTDIIMITFNNGKVRNKAWTGKGYKY